MAADEPETKTTWIPVLVRVRVTDERLGEDERAMVEKEAFRVWNEILSRIGMAEVNRDHAAVKFVKPGGGEIVSIVCGDAFSIDIPKERI